MQQKQKQAEAPEVNESEDPLLDETTAVDPLAEEAPKAEVPAEPAAAEVKAPEG